MREMMQSSSRQIDGIREGKKRAKAHRHDLSSLPARRWRSQRCSPIKTAHMQKKQVMQDRDWVKKPLRGLALAARGKSKINITTQLGEPPARDSLFEPHVPTAAAHWQPP